MGENLVPAAELARRSPVRFPNESAEYRAALLAEEISCAGIWSGLPPSGALFHLAARWWATIALRANTAR